MARQEQHPPVNEIDRRAFLRAGGAAAATLAGCAHAARPAAPAPASPAAGTVAAAAPSAAGEGKRIQRYRTLGRTGFQASDLGLGMTRITEPNVMRFAYDLGLNFFDTAEGYLNGEAERQLGLAMAHMERSRIFVVTKLKLHPGDTDESIRHRAGKCLERLNTSYVDALYMHGPSTADEVKHEGFHKAAAQLKSEGKVKHLGISSHGPRGKDGDSMQEVLLAAVEDGRFDLMLLVYNFLNHEEGDVVLKACKERNLGTTAMKVSPGILAVAPFNPDNPSPEHEVEIARGMAKGASRDEAIESLEKKLRKDVKKMAADRPRLQPFVKRYGWKTQEEVNRAGIQWVLSNELMHTTCVTMYDFDRVEKTIALSGTGLSLEGLALLRAFEAGPGHDHCRHGCGDCAEACPFGLPVSTIMRYAYYFHLQHREKDAMAKYAALGASNASHCEDCDAPCMDACPHGVRTQANLIQAHRLLAYT